MPERAIYDAMTSPVALRVLLFRLGGVVLLGHVASIAPVGRIGVVVGEDGAGEGLDFAEGNGPPAERIPSDARRLDTAANA